MGVRRKGARGGEGGSLEKGVRVMGRGRVQSRKKGQGLRVGKDGRLRVVKRVKGSEWERGVLRVRKGGRDKGEKKRRVKGV